MSNIEDNRPQRLDLVAAFRGRQETLRSKLESGRRTAYHPQAAGDAAELDWMGMLREFLPAKYAIDKAFVVDADGRGSDQIDVVIYDRIHSPLLFQTAGTIYVPAESVYSVLEVKPAISKATIEYAGEKAESVRVLERTSVDIPHAGGVYPPKPPGPIVAGLLCVGSDWSPPLGEAFQTALAGLPEEKSIDLGCILDHGAFEVIHQHGTVNVTTSSREDALIWFAIRLFQHLQRLATAPAIDIERYGRHISGA